MRSSPSNEDKILFKFYYSTFSFPLQSGTNKSKTEKILLKRGNLDEFFLSQADKWPEMRENKKETAGLSGRTEGECL